MTTETHVHEWIEERVLCERLSQFACSSCGHSTAGCNTCNQPLETANAICDRCLTREREVLADTRRAWDLIDQPHRDVLPIGSIDHDTRTTGRDDTPIVPIGAADRATGQDDFAVILDITKANPSRTVLDLLRDPENVLDVLHERADDWATQADTTATGDVLAWLTSRLLWAANTLPTADWEDYRNEVRQVRWKLRHIAGITPERNIAPCVHCGGKVVQDWADQHGRPFTDGLSDTLRCTGCGTTWGDHARFDYLNLTTVRALPETHPDALVTLEEARAALPRAKRNTINQRIKRDRDREKAGRPRLIPERGENLRGQALYRLGDLTGEGDTAGGSADTATG
ncbi:hypothetical protein [Occultella kanbiaonis]|uniref:hypothetical protein n=1 Tax=Occultella kanbiaonis TaxID=2675754 RepID=UPI0013D3BBBC|nr:hypothetical protein [Occultella kanbiaonis]